MNADDEGTIDVNTEIRDVLDYYQDTFVLAGTTYAEISKRTNANEPLSPLVLGEVRSALTHLARASKARPENSQKELFRSRRHIAVAAREAIKASITLIRDDVETNFRSSIEFFGRADEQHVRDAMLIDARVAKMIEAEDDQSLEQTQADIRDYKEILSCYLALREKQLDEEYIGQFLSSAEMRAEIEKRKERVQEDERKKIATTKKKTRRTDIIVLFVVTIVGALLSWALGLIP